MEKASDSSSNNSVKVQDILRIFETNDSKPKSQIILNNNDNNNIRQESKNCEKPSVNVCSWSVRRRSAKVATGGTSAGIPIKTAKEQPRVSEIVQRFQGKQLPSQTNDVDKNRKLALSNEKINHKNISNACDDDETKEDLYVDNIQLRSGAANVLPKGPPPQKPSRTFEHDIYLRNKGVQRGKSEVSKPKLPPKPIRSKTVPAMKTMKQIESHSNSKYNRPRTPPPPRPTQKELKGLKATGGGGSAKLEKSRQHYGRLKKCLSAERIYDEPWCSSWTKLVRKPVNDFELVDNDIYSGSGEGTIEGNLEMSKDSGESLEKRGELHYMSSPLFPMGDNSIRSKAFAFPRPLTVAPPSRVFNRTQSIFDENGKERKVTFVDKDVLNWSFMSIYTPSNPNDELGLTSKDNDSDNEISEKELQKRIDYVQKVSRSISVNLDCHDQRLLYRKQFDAVLIVGLRFEGDDNTLYEPFVKNIFPTEESLTAATPQDVAHFCFPDAKLWKPTANRETYTFVLTNDKGDRKYGYCRRVKPDGVEYNIPVVYCIMSPVLDRAYYSQLLHEIEKRHGLPESKMKSLIQTLYSRAVPQPGKTTIIRRSSFDGESQVALSRSNEFFADNFDTSKLLSRFSISVLLKIFSSFLLERRVIFCASQPETLSESIHSLVSLLYPFQWPHTLIPILPNKLIDVVASPTPFIIGILSSSLPYLEGLSIDDEGMMVDLDSGMIMKEVGDEATIIPKKVHRALTTALKLIRHRTGEVEEGCPGSTLVSEAFLRMFIELIGHYQQHITLNTDGGKLFNVETFTQSPLSRGIQMFLTWFTRTQIFDLFIEASCSSAAFPSIRNNVFEQRIRERQLDADVLKPTLKYNVKEFSKKMINFGEKLIGLKSTSNSKT